jgi:hypothetical protein
MKGFFCSLLISCAFAAFGNDPASPILTNDVPITNYMRFGLCDNFWESATAEEMYERTEVIADKPLTWYLRATVTNTWASVFFLGMSNSFAFDLKTPDGFSIPKTAKGNGMNQGPASLTSFRANRFWRREGTGFSDFPKLTALFNFPSNGIYFLEFRYWTWNSNKFSLSNPVRLRVIKEASTNDVPAVSATNTPATNR